MGKGDKKSRRGKIWKGTYGVSRSRGKIKAHLRRAIAKPAPVIEVAVVAEKPKVKRTSKKKESTAG